MSKIEKYLGIANHDIQVANNSNELKSYVASILCEIDELQQENKQLKDNWNKLRKWIVYNKHNENTEQHYLVVDYGMLLDKMRELQGSD